MTVAGRMQTIGTKELIAKLSMIGKNYGRIASQALYEGAAVVANEYKKATKEIVTQKRDKNEPRTEARYPTPEEKAAIKIGISKFWHEGDEINTSIGAAEGYTTINGQKKAIKLIANSINSGTSFMHKQPVFRKALSRARKPAQSVMEQVVNQELEKIINK